MLTRYSRLAALTLLFGLLLTPSAHAGARIAVQIGVPGSRCGGACSPRARCVRGAHLATRLLRVGRLWSALGARGVDPSVLWASWLVIWAMGT